ncbi:MAG: penicillin-binding transpeptidase domain-containing protein [Deltaproteobacteria bacterium]|jgi:cell division protein FtsI/penicillin-binding protein 2|nr:penicillin-binding transpeptidase domain-containing protein [Deltaproteobacteria bacterium]MCL5879836.1 penicillin-binding transpeptidase domain-containing protein [Deltaproteobacteria bacterium]
MERIKDWKSYQKILNRQKRKKNNFASSIKLIGFLIFVILLAYGSVRMFYLGKSYILIRSKQFQGTGIRPINSIKDKDGAVKSAIMDFNPFLDAGFSIKSLKTYFKHNAPVFNEIKDGRYIQKIGGYTIVYTIKPVIQKETEKTFKEYAVPFGVMAAVNPDTGAVLGLVSYSRNKKRMNEISGLIPYPPGSLTKIITASAAIESKGFYPGFNICYNGGIYGTNKSYWKQNISTGLNRISFSLAFAKSCDVAFGKVAGFYVGKRLLMNYFNKFYFNKNIPFILNLQESRADVPNNFYRLELTGAGFENVKVTPLQAALISAAIINGGKLVEPYIIEKIIGPDGHTLYTHRGIKVLDDPITVKTAFILKQMMIKTITSGIGRPDFYNAYNQYMLPGVIAGGKTGTISGNNPEGLYQWFAGFGESNGKKIALSTLVIEKPVWRITGGGVAEKTLFAYFFKHNSLKIASLQEN